MTRAFTAPGQAYGEIARHCRQRANIGLIATEGTPMSQRDRDLLSYCNIRERPKQTSNRILPMLLAVRAGLFLDVSFPLLKPGCSRIDHPFSLKKDRPHEAGPVLRDAVARYCAAFSIRSTTACGCETMTTWEAPSTTTVAFEPARFAMKASASAGIFLSPVP